MVDENSQGLSLKELRILERQERILDAAARLFAENGFHRTTTKDIAQKAGVSEGTLYNHFDSKDELLLALMGRLSQTMQRQARLVDSLPEDPRDYLSSLLHVRKEFTDRNSDILKTVLSEILVNPVLRERYYRELIRPLLPKIETHLKARSEMGQIRSLDPAVTARVLVALTMGLDMLDVLGDPVVRNWWEPLTRNAVDMLFHGLSPDETGSTARTHAEKKP